MAAVTYFWEIAPLSPLLRVWISLWVQYRNEGGTWCSNHKIWYRRLCWGVSPPSSAPAAGPESLLCSLGVNRDAGCNYFPPNYGHKSIQEKGRMTGAMAATGHHSSFHCCSAVCPGGWALTFLLSLVVSNWLRVSAGDPNLWITCDWALPRGTFPFLHKFEYCPELLHILS